MNEGCAGWHGLLSYGRDEVNSPSVKLEAVDGICSENIVYFIRSTPSTGLPMLFKSILTPALLLFLIDLSGQLSPFASHPSHLHDDSFARWIAPDGEDTEGVFYFRRNFKLETRPDSFIVHVSADNRYRLYVNGNLVCWGPAAGDLYHWNYETVDLASWLKSGENLLAAVVWNPGQMGGVRQITEQTGFILQGPPGYENLVHTDSSWRVFKEHAYQFLKMSDATAGGGYIAGATEQLNGATCSWGWEQIGFDDSRWNRATEIGVGNHSGLDTWSGTPWLLHPRSIPMMEMRTERSPEIIFIRGTVDINDHVFPFTIPAHSRIEILMDQGTLTMGYPQLDLSGGKGSRITVRYQESLFDPQGRKGNRNEWQDKTMKGIFDVFLTDGRECRYEPLWIRVFRYVQLMVETRDEPLTIQGFRHLYTAYPFEEKGTFQSNDSSLDQIWEASWRTARLCALETYMDCPYYEQLQYIGDTRIQAMISYYVAGNDLLAKNALMQFRHSMQPMGLTQSRYPARGRQIIPPFSLYYISMLHDYYMYREDHDFIGQFIPGIGFILDWFTGRIDSTGILGPLPFWNHIDGGTGFANGSPPGISDGGSAHMSLLLAYTLDKAAELMEAFGKGNAASRYRDHSASLKECVLTTCYNKEKGLIAETPAQKFYSQHTNSFALLTGLFQGEQARTVASKLISDPGLIQATLYFRYYLFQALKLCGMGDQVLNLLDPWRECLETGLTTFPEHGTESRSDCHAWSAHPLYDLLGITCGIEPASPGFSSVLIAPQPGKLEWFSGKVPHPRGEIRIEMKKNDVGVHFSIRIPEKVPGSFRYNGQIHALEGGQTQFTFPRQ